MAIRALLSVFALSYTLVPLKNDIEAVVISAINEIKGVCRYAQRHHSMSDRSTDRLNIYICRHILILSSRSTSALQYTPVAK